MPRLYRAKRFKDGQWVCGYYVYYKSDDTHCIIDENDGILELIDLNTLGQQVGIQDKDGLCVYEGDIMEDDKGNKGVIVWLDNDAKYILNDMTEYIEGNTDEETYIMQRVRAWNRVVGNIRDNPELLSD